MDVGLTHFYTDSNGQTVDNPRHLKKSEKALKRLNRKLSRTQKGSKNRVKARNRLSRKYLKVSRQREDKARKDALARQVDVETEIWDFFDVNGLWERQEKVASTSMAVTVAGAVGARMIGGFGWLDGALTATKVVGVNNVRKLVIPGVIAAGKLIYHLHSTQSTANIFHSRTRSSVHSLPDSQHSPAPLIR